MMLVLTVLWPDWRSGWYLSAAACRPRASSLPLSSSTAARSQRARPAPNPACREAQHSPRSSSPTAFSARLHRHRHLPRRHRTGRRGRSAPSRRSSGWRHGPRRNPLGLAVQPACRTHRSCRCLCARLRRRGRRRRRQRRGRRLCRTARRRRAAWRHVHRHHRARAAAWPPACAACAAPHLRADDCLLRPRPDLGPLIAGHVAQRHRQLLPALARRGRGACWLPASSPFPQGRDRAGVAKIAMIVWFWTSRRA